MSGKWRELDLGGGGLQAANLRLARTLRRRRVAWGLLLAFPLGLHRRYLGEPRSAIAFPALSAVAAAGGYAGMTVAALGALLALAALLAYDILTMERRITACNKRQRMAVYLSGNAGAPAGFRGRFGDAEAGAPPATAPAATEQETLLREIAAHKDNTARPPR